MKINSKSVKAAIAAVETKKKAAKVSKTPAAAKIKALISRFYVMLRGTPLQLSNCRKADYAGQSFVAAPSKTVSSVVIAPGTYGTTVSAVQAHGTVVKLDTQRGFDMTQVPKARVLHLKEALLYFRKHGTPHVVRQAKAEMKGLLLGNLDDMYVGFLDMAKGTFRTLETKSISDKRNKANLFSLVK